MTSRYPRILTSLKRVTPALLLTLTEACSGGQTTELNDDDCQQDPAWQELELEAFQESALAQLTGEYTTLLHWLDATTPPGTAADERLLSTTELRITHRYVGSPRPTRTCSGSLLLPVVTTLRTSDAQLDAEFLSLFDVDPAGVLRFSEWTVTETGEPWLPVAKGGADDAMDATRAVEIHDATAASLPTWDEWVTNSGGDRGVCAQSYSTLTPGAQAAGSGHLCIPNVGVGVWPEAACGGLGGAATDVPSSSGVSFETLVSQLGTIEVITSPKALLTVTVTSVGDLCHIEDDDSAGWQASFYLGQVRVSVSFGDDQKTANATVEWLSEEPGDSLAFSTFCVEVSDAQAITASLRLSLPQYNPLTGCDAEERELCAASKARYEQLEAAAEDGLETATLCLTGSLLDRPTPRFSAVDAAGATIQWMYQWTTIDSN